MPNLRALAKKVLPPAAGSRFRDIESALRRRDQRRARQALAAAGTDPAYLDLTTLENLQAAYARPPAYGYDPETLEDRGAGRAKQLLSMTGGDSAKSFLEVGCYDGMVALALHRAGKEALATDFRSGGFDPRAVEAGVVRQMDAAALEIGDASVDFVYSYDAFEHFAQPDAVLAEAIRVLRPGGHIYLLFGPLYLSPFGEHVEGTIHVPYCHVLFTHETLNEFSRSQGLPEIDADHVNRWTVAQFRGLWATHSSSLRRLRYREMKDARHLSLVQAYPTCFKAKTSDLDDRVVATIEVLFEKV